MLSSRTTTSLVIESISDRPVCTSTLVTRDSQREDNRGESSGTGTTSSRRPSMAATRRSISTYSRTSGPPMSSARPAASGTSSTPTR